MGMASKLMGAAGCLSATVFGASVEDQKPNIIFILTDDQGFGDLERHGHPLLKTPNLNRLYDEGVRFNRFYVSPTCSPTRAALLTGRHEFRNGITYTEPPRDRLPLDAVLIPQLLKRAGYTSACIGKWHNGKSAGYLPHERGFDFTADTEKAMLSTFDHVIVRNGVPQEGAPVHIWREDLLFNEAMDFIETHRTGPFFCYLATYSPHAPYTAVPGFIEPYAGKMTDPQAAFLSMIANIDWNIGRLLAKLQELGLDQNTVIIAMNDNGETIGLDLHNAGMRGGKSTPWEGGTRAFSLWRWPGHWKPRTEGALTAHLDVLPTLCELAGVQIPYELKSKLDGYSLLPLLESPDGAFPRDRMLFHHSGRWADGTARDHKHALGSVQQGDWYLTHAHHCTNPVCYVSGGRVCGSMHHVSQGLKEILFTKQAQFHWGMGPFGQWALYNLREDRHCLNNVAGEHPELTARLAEAYDQWWDSLFPGLLCNEPEAGKDVPR